MSTKILSKRVEGSHEWILDNGWKAQKSDRTGVNGVTIDEIGKKITSPGYNTSDWLDAVVPGTVLATLVKNGIYQDPYYGLNNKKIPDISKEGPNFYTYWFYTTFKVPALDPPQEHVWLNFRGINYSAEIYLNGKALTPRKVSGMFLRRSFDITSLVSPREVNLLAVLVYPPDPPGIPSTRNGGEAGKPNIGENVTMRYPVGWDWVIPIRDRNTGIWDQVSISTSGPVVIRDPHVITRVPGQRKPGKTQDPAVLTISAQVFNASDTPQSGVLAYNLEGNKSEKPFTLQGGETLEITFDELELENPRLWWPNGYGTQELYALYLAARVLENVSDHKSLQIGIREIGVEGPPDPQNPELNSRVFKINGQRIFPRGGNWIGTDAMLRLSDKRYHDEVRLTAGMNLNMLRVWGGGIAERPEFYEACDQYGILVMQDFWISGEYFDSNPPEDYTKIFLDCVKDTIKMLRNHPSLLFWCGGNEQVPPAEINSCLKCYIGEKGPNGEKQKPLSCQNQPVLDTTRIYVERSTAISNSSTGQYDDGPYGIQKPGSLFERHSNAFNPEIGSVGTPVVESIRAMMPQEAAEDFPKDQDWNDVWTYHTYIPYSDPQTYHVPDQIALYGCPKSLEEFCLKAQIVNYVQYKSLIEGWNSHMWEWYTGVLIWKSQNPWTGLRGQLYDWYLDQTGGFFGVCHAAEPVHIQLNLNDNKVIAVNNLFHDLTDVTARARVYDLEGVDVTPPNSKKSGTVPPVSTQEFFTLEITSLEQGVYFVKLELTGADSRLLSENFYWVSTLPDSDFRDLNSLPKIDPETTLEIVKGKEEYNLKLSVKNPEEKGIVFFIRLKLLKKGSGNRPDQRVLPALYDDNYFSLLPKEEKELHICCNHRDSGDEEPELWIEGWNVDCRQILPGK